MSLDTDFTLDNCAGGLYASLSDGIRMTMYVCNFLCALYNIHASHGKSIFFSAIWYFYVHCDLVLFASEAHGICEICLTDSAS